MKGGEPEVPKTLGREVGRLLDICMEQVLSIKI